MKHYDEKTIVLFALGSEKIAHEREMIKKHFEECYSCKEMFDEVKLFYEEAFEENILEINEQKLLSTNRLMVEPSIRSNKKSTALFPKTIISKSIYFARTRPVQAGVSLMAACIFLFGLINVPKLLEDRTPDFIVTNETMKRIEVFNKTGHNLFDLYFDTKRNYSEDEINVKYSELVDLYGDGKKKLVSVIPTLGPANNEFDRLKVFDEKGKLIYSKKVGETVKYNDKEYNDNFTTRGMIIDDFGNNGKKEILVGTAHRNSPYVLTRLDAYGKKLGEYWHYGHFWGFNEIDLNNDGKKEIVLCGIEDNSEQACISIINPLKILSSTESAHSSTFHLPKFTGEMNYITFPTTILSKYLEAKPRIKNMISFSYDKLTIYYSLGREDKAGGLLGFDITLNHELKVRDIKFTDATVNLIKEVEAARKIKNLKSQITKAFLNN